VIFNADMTGEEEKLHLWPSPVFEQRQGSGMIYAIMRMQGVFLLSESAQVKMSHKFQAKIWV